MSQNIQQIFVANPASSMVSTDLLYLGRSPYGPNDDFAITFANFVASIGTATPTASTIPRWDAHVNMSANNFLAGFASTATAAGTTTLTVSSAYNQYFTGSTTQTVVLPVTSTLALGFPFRIINNSTGVVTVQSSGANTIQAMAPGSTLLLTCILTSGTTAASWDAQYIIASDVSGAVLLAPTGIQTITTYGLVLPSVNFSSTAGIIGTTTNDNAAAGSVGELISSVVLIGSSVSLSSGNIADVTSISLTAGDWDVWGNVGFNVDTTTNTSFNEGWINEVSATAPDYAYRASVDHGPSGQVAAFLDSYCVPQQRISLATTTTVYLSVAAVFTISTNSAYGGIYARRRH